MAIAERRMLPDTRESVTHKAVIQDRAMGDVSLFLTVGMYPAEVDAPQEPGEVWINIGKQGTTLRGLTDTVAISISLALQHGVPLRTIVDQFKSHRYEPMGQTTNPEIPACVSIIDYVVKWMELRFLKEEENAA